MVSLGNGFFDDSGTVRSAANQSLDPTLMQKRSMCLAIMAWTVCWKRVLMKNPSMSWWGSRDLRILQRSQRRKNIYKQLFR